MKYLLLLICTIFTVVAHGQENGDTKVLIKTALSEDESYKAIGQYLISQGIELEKADPTFKTIETESFRVKTDAGYLYSQVLYVAIKDNLVTVTSFFKQRGMRGKNAVYQKGKATEKAFENMRGIASAINGEVSYSK